MVETNLCWIYKKRWNRCNFSIRALDVPGLQCSEFSSRKFMDLQSKYLEVQRLKKVAPNLMRNKDYTAVAIALIYFIVLLSPL